MKKTKTNCDFISQHVLTLSLLNLQKLFAKEKKKKVLITKIKKKEMKKLLYF